MDDVSQSDLFNMIFDQFWNKLLQHNYQLQNLIRTEQIKEVKIKKQIKLHAEDLYKQQTGNLFGFTDKPYNQVEFLNNIINAIGRSTYIPLAKLSHQYIGINWNYNIILQFKDYEIITSNLNNCISLYINVPYLSPPADEYC